MCVERDFLPNKDNNPYLELPNDEFAMNHYSEFESLVDRSKFNLKKKGILKH